MKTTKSVKICLLLFALLLLFVAGCGQSADPYADELCFPGLNWNMTPEQAIKALKLSEGDYTESKIEANSLDPDIYAFRVEHYEIFGTDAGITFQFHDYDGNGTYHLQRVNMGVSPDADMEAVEAEMMKIFGEGRPDYQPGRYWESQTPCIEFLTDAQVNYLSRNTMLNDVPDDPISQIRLHIESIIHFGHYNGKQTNNTVSFFSEYSHITQENGYPVP